MKLKTVSKLKPLNLGKLRRDLQLIMDEIDRTNGVLPDAYSPVMWQRLQNTAEKVSNAIQSVRLVLGGMTADEAASKVGIGDDDKSGKMMVAGYMAWNTMLQPDWVAPRIIIRETACPKCGAQAGERCDYSSAPAHKIHRERREAHLRAA
jgi:hypothetical protein